jgi:CheY-like chemotaxis protein
MSNSENVTVLLIEDDDVDAEAVKRSFRKKGIGADLQRAENGAQALEILRSTCTADEKAFRIIFLDLNMPGVNGHEFLAQLREDAKLKKTPVFVLTTSDHVRDVELAYERNVAGYFTKPHLDDLLAVLDSYLDGALLPPT